MKASRRIRRVPVARSPHSETSVRRQGADDNVGVMPLLRRKLRGQALVIFALSAVLLVAAVGLAVDGGSMYTERRAAQNATDSSALAGTKLFVSQLEATMQQNPGVVPPPPGSAGQETQILNTILQYAATNGVDTNTVQAYFVDNQKQIVSVSSNPVGGSSCGVGNGLSPCQVGQNGEVPWDLGAIGITVSGQAETGAFFVRVIGWNTISATARSTALVEVDSTTDNIPILPLGLFTSTIDIRNIQFGHTYVLINGDLTQGAGGEWGWVTFNGYGDANTAKAWLQCGYNPLVDSTKWPTWCPGNINANGYAPTQHWRSTINPDPTDFHPEANAIWVPYLQYGYQALGWWLQSSSGTTNSACSTLHDAAYANRTNTPDGFGVYLYFPIFDATYHVSSLTLYHLRAIATFFISNLVQQANQPGQDISCKKTTPPTSTPCPGPTCFPTPTPPSGNQNVNWYIQGKAVRFYGNNTDSGQIGDIFHAIGRVVVLDR
jgi:Flp pilus assembly protein TadG